MEEVARCSVASERYWTEEKERALIAFYSKHSCLWNHKSEGYKNRQLRCKTLEHLRVVLSAHPPPVSFTGEDIKSKFKNLRTTFQRQYKMVSASGQCSPSDEVFVSQWKYFHDLLFLTSSSRQEHSSDEDPATQQLEKEVVKMENEPVFPPATSSSCSSSSSSSFSSNGSKCYWTEEKERALISFYAEHGCLWNKKSVNHNNRQLRLRTLELLHKQLSEGEPLPFTVEDIKSKFNNLRTVFNREFKAANASSSRDSDQARYVSQWKHYDQLMFLRESCEDDTENNPDRLQPLPLAAQQEEEEELDLKAGSGGGPCLLPDATNGFSSCSTQMDVKLEEPDSPEPADFHCLPPDFHQADSKTDIPLYIPAGGQCQVSISARQERHGLAAPVAPLPPTCLSGFTQVGGKLGTGALNRSLASLAFPAMNSAQTGCARPGTDPRCHWTEAKVCELISFYADHSCLWNHRSESYRNRALRQSTLETLSRQLSHNHPVPFTVEEIKTKFRNLRTIFQREHKAMNSNRTSGSEDFCLPKWRHYRQLLFLCDSCDGDEAPDPDPGSLPFIGHLQEDGLLKLTSVAPPSSSSSSLTSPHVFHQSEHPRLTVAAAHHHHHPDGPSSPTPPASFHSSPSSGSGSSCSPANHLLSSSSSFADGRGGGPPSGLKRPSHLMAHSSSGAGPPPPPRGTLGFLGSCCHGLAASPHAGFLKYVEECLNETPPDKVKRLKKMIIETIHSTSEEM